MTEPFLVRLLTPEGERVTIKVYRDLLGFIARAVGKGYQILWFK